MQPIGRTKVVRVGWASYAMYAGRTADPGELADMRGVSAGRVSCIGTRKALPNLSFLFRFRSALRVPMHELLPPG